MPSLGCGCFWPRFKGLLIWCVRASSLWVRFEIPDPPLRAGGMFEDPVGRGGAEGTTSSPVSISARTGVCVQSLWHLSRGGLEEPELGGGTQGGGRADRDL